ncbi:MAG: F0F1 ATP synthase subunit gamma [Alphaproteobacteria bacterium TMED89]|nr:F0F1 ATP synthase subunit gamma [Rhodospirillaceae bacterium]RPH10124.1 MAG: F0F1 ATP synthase subunit gamma [Alphaproteobacteria bacterium TMED89]
MASLKDLRDRIGSVKNTRKITSAMKMVAAAKLRRAQDQAEASRPYAERMERMLSDLASRSSSDLPLMAGTGKSDTHLIILGTADRGLCGGFNANLVKETRRMTNELQSAGKQVKIYCIGKKGAQALNREFGDLIVKRVEDLDKPALSYSKAGAIADDILTMFDDGAFDAATLIYARFQSAIAQIVTRQQLIPFAVEADEDAANVDEADDSAYEFEPSEDAILAELLPRNVGVQVFKALLENAASEQGARMTAMDNATRNAGEMIDKLTLLYNRSRQASITKELIEIVSGAEAL